MLSRREFLKFCGKLSIALVGTSMFANEIAYGLTKLSNSERPKLLFIQGQSCSGCTTSLMYGNESNFIDFIMNIVRLQVHPTLSFDDSQNYIDKLNKLIKSKDYILILEGAIPAKQKKACMVGDEILYDLLYRAIENTNLCVSIGTCASYGGIPASSKNELGSIGLGDYLLNEGFTDKKFIRIPGCPVHPDRLIGTIAYFLSTNKLPPLTKEKTPEIYYGETIHNHCGRFQFFSQDIYLIDYDKTKTGCLLKKGCRGPITKSDCPTRRWNGNINVCINSNAPCVGCIHKNWPFKQPLYLSADKFKDLNWLEMRKKIDPNFR